MKGLSHFIEKIEPLLPSSPDEIDWSKPAFRWRQKKLFRRGIRNLEPIVEVAFVDPKNIQNVERQKEILLSNTEQFVKDCRQTMYC